MPLDTSEAELTGAFRTGLEGKGILGIAGTIGIDGVGRCELLGFWVGCGRVEPEAVAEDGVVGCVESDSEGA